MRLNGAEITGIKGFDNYAPVDKLSGDELDNIIAQLVSSAGGLESYK
jgi:hypothetical protein